MESKKHFIVSIVFVFILFLAIGCKKQNEWLNVKSNKSSVVPETLADFQAMFDDDYFVNSSYYTPGLIGADNIYFTDEIFNSSPELSRNLYTWKKELNPQNSSVEWNSYFKIIEISNAVLDGLQKVGGNGVEYNSVKGQALFHRAIAYYELAQLFCKPYSSTANLDLGLPLRTTSDVNIVAQRSSLQETYNSIINDATEASSLLPVSQPFLERATKPAAYALLARTYLNMANYDFAEKNASNCLKIRSQLLDFNNSSLVSNNTEYRFPIRGKNNPEVLFYAECSTYEVVPSTYGGTALVDNDFYNSYDENDLRKSFFYSVSGKEIKNRGTYTGDYTNFCGIAINEVYLIRAECLARLNNIAAAMADLNKLLENRYITGTYKDQLLSNIDEALTKILSERRKELPFTGNRRWEDLRRLNLEPRFQKKLIRIVNGNTYILLPNDNLYTFPIPQDEILLSGIKQNPR